MTRILILMLGAMLTLAGCGGGSDGLEYGTPKVTVKNLQGSVTVFVGGDSHTFSSDGFHTFSKVQDNKNYRISISGDSACTIAGGYEGADGEKTRSTTSKNASEHFIVDCSSGSSGEDDDEGEKLEGHTISATLKGNIGINGNSPITEHKPATVEV